MSMSTFVYGIRPADDDFKAKAAAWNACEAAGVPIPETLLHFFNSVKPDPAGVVVGVCQHGHMKPALATSYRDDMREGYEVKVEDLVRHGFKVVRFVNSW